MTVAATIVFWVLLGLVVAQGLMVCRFVRALFRGKRGSRPEPPGPKTAVVLCLRGADPCLPACIEGLLDQDYPDYHVHIVVDSRQDPAWQIAEEVVRRRKPGNVRIVVLAERRDTCSLKCSGVVQAVSGLDESYGAVALVDADTVPHPGWLGELLAPLADERVGAATGNRWYMPGQGSWGALARYLWNAAAVVQMYWYRIPWGGSLALKTEILRQSDLLQRWGNAFCEDTMLYRALRRQGLRVAFVPSLMMVNREQCNLGDFFRWARRQLLTARLYHPRWPAVVAHGIGTSCVLALAAGLLAAALLTRRWDAAGWAALGLGLYFLALPLLLAPMEACVRRIVRARGEATRWMTASGFLHVLAAIPLTQVVYPAALVSAMLVRMVDWRGVTYRIEGPWRIRLMQYDPYDAGRRTTQGTASL
jgi:cellulose synthase/poly-beta-1,6-N-acetylglucosamine synthase-like glycosyltransferase